MDFAVAILQYENEILEHVEGRGIGMHEFCSNKYYFEIIEDQEEINIQDIEEFKVVGCNVEFNGGLIPTESLINDMQIDKINKLIKAIKQLDNKIKESK